MSNFLKIISIIVISFFNIKATNIFCDLKSPVYAAYYYDVGSLYIKANNNDDDVNVVLFGQDKIPKQLAKPEKKRKPGILNKFGIGKTDQRVILIAQDESELKEFIDKSVVQKIDNNNIGSAINFYSESIIAIHVPTKNDFLCIKDNLKQKLNFFLAENEACAYKNKIYKIAKKKYDNFKKTGKV